MHEGTVAFCANASELLKQLYRKVVISYNSPVQSFNSAGVCMCVGVELVAQLVNNDF